MRFYNKSFRLFLFPLILLSLVAFSCTQGRKNDQAEEVNYYDYSQRQQLTGGVKMIPISTPSGDFKVWTKRVGNNPTQKVLLLHGGPGMTHEYFEAFDSYLPKEGIEYYYYDQLGSAYSDQPMDSTLWTVDRFVEEVEQVRKALGLDSDNFYLLGHSWGGILAIEYALKYQKHLKGLVISNMMSSVPDYIEYAEEEMAPTLDSDILKEIRELEENGNYSDPKYTQLVEEHYYPKHVLRMPLDEWPEPVNRSSAHVNEELYVTMQGPSEFGVVGDAKLKNWDRSDDLSKIEVPTLVIGASYDTMDPEHMQWMATEVENGRPLICPEGSHYTMYDDQETYFEGLTKFVEDEDAGRF